MDDSQPGSSRASSLLTFPSPKKKRPKTGQLSSSEKTVLVNVYKYVEETWPKDKYPYKTEIVQKTAEIVGVSTPTVYSVLKEYKTHGRVQSPPPPATKPSSVNELDEIELGGIRRKVHQFYFANEMPSINKMLEAVNSDESLPNFSRTTFFKVLKKLGFKYSKRNRKSILIDRSDIALWRINYLNKIEEERKAGKKIYYLDETWVNEGHTKDKVWQDTTIKSTKEAHRQGLSTGLKNPSGKGKRLILGHIGFFTVFSFIKVKDRLINSVVRSGFESSGLKDILPQLPPGYQCLWMSSISSGTLSSLNERVYLEKATDRLIYMLRPEPSLYYTHNPALLLWAFISRRIHENVRLQVLSQWFKMEDSLPSELISDPGVWELLLSILTSSKDTQVLQNCNKTIYSCLEEIDDDGKEEFGLMVWPMLPDVLAKSLIDFDNTIETNICYLLELSSALVPEELDDALCLKLAVLTTAIFTKDRDESRYDYEFACLRLSLYLLSFANKQNDNRVLVTYINRAGFLPCLLSATNSMDTRVACIALQLLSYIVHYFTKNNYQPKYLLQIQSHQIIKSLRDDSSSERGASLLQLLYMILNSGPNTPLVLSCDLEVSEQQYDALRALMLRIQMLCCKESKNQPSGAWKTLGAIFRHAIFNKNDSKLVATLTSQPWTHTLIHFQMKQDVTEDFLAFIQTWLSLMKITLKNSREKKRSRLSKQSLVGKSLFLIKKYLVVGDDDGVDVKQKILGTVEEILDDSDLNV